MPEQPLWQHHRAKIEALADLPLNFELERRSEYTSANGWHIDDYQAELPAEPPGPPVAGGSWMIAQQMLREYRFPDPRIVTGIYYPDQPLEKRVMLLRARAFCFTFWFGVRVGDIIDEVRADKTGSQQIWGFNYQTLKGHFERGQMDFMVIKWLESGNVAFHIHAFSQPAEIKNPIFRLGFHLFGRRVQRRFAHRALERMQALVREQLAPTPEKPILSSGPSVQPASVDPAAAAQLAKEQKQD